MDNGVHMSLTGTGTVVSGATRKEGSAVTISSHRQHDALASEAPEVRVDRGRELLASSIELQKHARERSEAPQHGRRRRGGGKVNDDGVYVSARVSRARKFFLTVIWMEAAVAIGGLIVLAYVLLAGPNHLL
jgi:hypothetical protein